MILTTYYLITRRNKPNCLVVILKAQLEFNKDLKTSKPWFLSGGINLNNIELIRTKFIF